MTNNSKVIFETSKGQTQFYSKVCFTFLVFMFLGGFVAKAQITWTGGAAGNWNVASNWDSGTIPGATDQVIIANATVNLGGSNITVGSINFNGVTLNNGSFNTNSTSLISYIRNKSTINVPIHLTSNTIVLFDNTFNAQVTLNKAGSANVWVGTNSGKNIFNENVYINGLSGASGAMYLGLGGGDTFVKDLFIDNQSSASFYLASTSGATQFGGNISLSGNNGAIAFGVIGGSAQLAAGKTISEGTTGLTGTTVYLSGMNIPTNLTLDAPQSAIYLGSRFNFNGYYYENGSQFQGTVNVTANTIIAY